MEDNKVWVCVYRGTIEEHNEDDNLSEIIVERSVVEQYFKDKNMKEYYDSVDDFLDEHIADETDDFYEYAKAHGVTMEINVAKAVW